MTEVGSLFFLGFLNLFLTLARALLVAIEHFRQRSEGVGNRNLSISDLCEAEAELVLASESKLAGTHETVVIIIT